MCSAIGNAFLLSYKIKILSYVLQIIWFDIDLNQYSNQLILSLLLLILYRENINRLLIYVLQARIFRANLTGTYNYGEQL